MTPAPKRRWFRWSLLKTDVRDLFKEQGRLVDDAFLGELRTVLVKDDMGVQAADAIVKHVATQFRARRANGGGCRQR
jgi:fused signal recognition particle receptor